MLDSLPMLTLPVKRSFALFFGIAILTSCVRPNECDGDSACSERSPKDDGAIQIPAQLSPISSDQDKINIQATLVGETLTLQSTDDDISFTLTIENVEEEQFFNNIEGDAGAPPVDFTMTSAAGSWSVEDLLFYNWQPQGEQHYEGGLMWETGDFRYLFVGERVTRTYRCIYDEFSCDEVEATMFSHQNIAPSDCIGERNSYALGSCSEVAVGVCDFGNFVEYFMPEVCNYPDYIENYAADCNYQELNGGCDAQN